MKTVISIMFNKLTYIDNPVRRKTSILRQSDTMPSSKSISNNNIHPHIIT